MADDIDEMEARVARITRPVVADKDVADRVVTQVTMASYIALIGHLALNQQRAISALVQGNGAEAEKFLADANEQMLELLDKLRNLVTSSGADT